MKKSQVEPPLCSPIPFTTGSNGEFVPRPKTARDERAEEMYRRMVDDYARKLGVSRREFIRSASGTAAALLVINQVYGCGDDGGGGGGTDGGFAVDANAAIDADQACEQLSGDEFVFDVQTHHVNPEGPWRGGMWEFALGTFPQAGCGEPDAMDCFDLNHYIREMFVNSETAVACLSAVPATDDDSPLNRQETHETLQVLEALPGSSRLITHGLVLADRGQAELDGMQNLVENLDISAWKTYTQFGSWRLDDANGIAFIEKARDLDVKIICAHKGLSLFGLDPAFADPADIGVVAKMFPDVNFVVYHSGYENGNAEGAYNPASTQGIDTLIRALEDNGIGPNENVYAELGSTWRGLMTAGDQAEHAIGKLIKHVGEDRVLWGTDSIWYGSPQDQIDAFRALAIRTQLQDDEGYPELTAGIKAKVLGLNAAALYGIDVDAVRCEIDADALTARRAELDRPALQLRDFGPRSRREFFAFLRTRDGMPG